MTSYHSLRIGVIAILLTVLLAVSAVPVSAQLVQPVRPLAVHVTGFGERVWNALVSLWPRAWEKEGMSIDPNGRNGQVVNPNPPVTPDEGVTIDPNGRV